MAATIYYTETTCMEQSYGKVTERVVVSDTYGGLFAGGGTSCNILEVTSSKKDFSLESGTYAQDELSFTLDEARVQIKADDDCIDFVLAAQTVTTKRYIAWFIQPEATLAVTEAEFVGLVKPEMKATDLTWKNHTEYDPDWQPVRTWELKASTFDEVSLEAQKLESLIYTGTDALITETAWIAANIKDRLGWFYDSTSDRSANFANLVNLNTFLTKISSIVATRISADIGDTFTIVIDTCTLDFKLSPARFYNLGGITKWGSPSATPDFVTRYVGGGTVYASPYGTKGLMFPYCYKIKDADAITMKLGDTATDAESPWISKHMFFYKNTEEDDANGADKDNSFLKLDNYIDLLTGIALTFGMFVRFYYSSTTELHVSFVPRNGMMQETTFIPDANDSDLTVKASVSSSEEQKKVFGVANQYAGENYLSPHYDDDTIYFINTDSYYKYTFNANKTNDCESGYPSNVFSMDKLEGDKLLLTISPTIRQQNVGEDQGTYTGTDKFYKFDDINLYMPHNGVFCDDFSALTRKTDSKRSPALWNSIGLHTAIYVQTTGAAETGSLTIGLNTFPMLVNYGCDTETIWSPAAALHVNDTYGGQATYFRLSDYIGYTRQLSQLSYLSERNLTVPYLCRFRRLEDGSDADDDSGRGRWQNVALANKLTILEGGNPVYWVITGIERDNKLKTTKLKLWNSSYNSYAEASGLTAALNVDGEGAISPPLIQAPLYELYSAAETIYQGNVVIINSDKTISRAKALSSHSWGKICGIALTGGTVGTDIMIALPGRAVNLSTWNFTTPNTPVYLHTNLVSADNISASPVTAKSITEDMSVLIGYGTGSEIQTLDFTLLANQLILTA